MQTKTTLNPSSNYTKREWVLIAITILTITLWTRVIINLSPQIGFVMFLLFLFPIVLCFKIENKALLTMGYIIFATVKINYLLTVEPVRNPDSVAYINYYGMFGYDYSLFFENFFYDISHNFIFANLFNTFGFLYITFFEVIGDYTPIAMNVYNTVLTILIIYLIYDIVKNHFPYEMGNKKLFNGLFLSLCLVSPQLIYWSSIVRKETTIMFFLVLSLWLLLNKRYFLLILVSAFAFTIRQYTFVPVILYFLIFKKMYKTAVFGTIISMVIVFFKSGITGSINTFYTLGISFFSPNPFRLENWSELFYRTTESVVGLIGMIACGIVFLTFRKARGFFVISFLCILSYTCVLELVSYDAALHYGIDYVVGAAGDDLSRKKFFIVFMVYMMIAYAIAVMSAKIRK
ncbi:hypothetical protein AS888_20860 [Peribacillus simplex]|uniref:Uncharacterized protein n=1 Tax=Peribacillus simplex TaxID=1478 RepID=A0A125QRU1_9BACI|nr:hypothetical protein [Peribacillus simplex]KWW17964.1 hypothetical protein AS888_20860 [Peribacillus simplex]